MQSDKSQRHARHHTDAAVGYRVPHFATFNPRQHQVFQHRHFGQISAAT